MLPPIPITVFEQNSKFKNLYNDLKAGRLNDDGSSKLIKKQRAQDELRKRLQTARLELAKTTIIRDALAKVARRSSSLPPELQQVVLVICSQLAGHLTHEDREVVVEDFEHFVENIEPISEAISTSISESARHITAAIAAVDDPYNSVFLPSASTLPAKANALRNSIAAQSSTLSTKTLQLADTAATSSISNREILQSTIRILEQHVHGSVSRATIAKSEHLATVARGMELKLAIISHEANPSNPLALAGDDELAGAMQRYAAHLRRARADASGDLANVEAKLREYDSGGQGMREIAKRYGQLTAEISEVKEEIARLQEAD